MQKYCNRWGEKPESSFESIILQNCNVRNAPDRHTEKRERDPHRLPFSFKCRKCRPNHARLEAKASVIRVLCIFILLWICCIPRTGNFLSLCLKHNTLAASARPRRRVAKLASMWSQPNQASRTKPAKPKPAQPASQHHQRQLKQQVERRKGGKQESNNNTTKKKPPSFRFHQPFYISNKSTWSLTDSESRRNKVERWHGCGILPKMGHCAAKAWEDALNCMELSDLSNSGFMAWQSGPRPAISCGPDHLLSSVWSDLCNRQLGAGWVYALCFGPNCNISAICNLELAYGQRIKRPGEYPKHNRP